MSAPGDEMRFSIWTDQIALEVMEMVQQMGALLAKPAARALAIVSLVPMAACAETLSGTTPAEKSLAALTTLFVVAVLLESAFALIFSWRVFLTYFSLSGWKTIIMLAISLLIVIRFELDVFAWLLGAYLGKTVPSDPVSITITSMILAGGSSAVNRVMVALNLRQPSSPPPPTPPADKAWIAVWVKKVKLVGEAAITLKDSGPASGHPDAPHPVAGTTAFRIPKLGELLFRNRNRFPQNGGYTVMPGNLYEIAVTGRDAQGGAISVEIGKRVFANGAIVDFEVTL